MTWKLTFLTLKLPLISQPFFIHDLLPGS